MRLRRPVRPGQSRLLWVTRDDTSPEWQALGNDTGGTALPAATTGSLPAAATAFAMSGYGARDGGGSRP